MAVPARGHSGLRGASHCSAVEARWIVVLGVVLPVVWVVLSRLIVPFDGSLHYFQPSVVGHRQGILLAWASASGPLRADDVVLDVDGQDVERGRIGSTPARGCARGHPYTIARGGVQQGVCIRAGPYPLVETVERIGPAVLLVATMMVVAVVVFLRRSRDSAARALFAIPVLLLLGATSWPFGPQVLDLVRPYGWLPYLVGSTANALLWGAVLHLALVLPAPLPLVRRHPRLVVAGYVLPFALYGGYIALRLPRAGNRIERLFLLLHVSLPAARSMPILIAVLVLARLLVARDRRERRREAGVLVVAGTCSAVYLALAQLPQVFGWRALPQQWVALVFLPFPLALGSAVLRRRLFDVELVLRRSLVYGALAACLTVVFATALLSVRTIFGGMTALPAVLAAGLTGLAVQPLYRRLRRFVGRRIFGDRVEPRAVAARLQQVDPIGEPHVVLGRLVDTLARTLRLVYAAAEVGPSEAGLRVEHGVRAGEPQRLPLLWGHQRLGYLLVTVEPGRERFGNADRRLLDEVTRQVSAVGYALLLTGELERSRRRLVLTREEERRRLRRDLHDGVGPALATIAMLIEHARDRVLTDPPGATRALDSLLDETRRSLAELRRLIEDLRPPALDELGLLGALRASAESLTGPARGMRVDVQGDGNLERLPAAVEVAAFRIAVEAILNAARHSLATSCHVRLRTGEVLAIDVEDDGRGLGEGTPEGVGITSMRERAAEVGGSLTIESRPGHGTLVRARLPLTPWTAATGQVGTDVP